MKRFLFLLTLFFTVFLLKAQTTETFSTKSDVEYYTVEDGWQKPSNSDITVATQLRFGKFHIDFTKGSSNSPGYYKSDGSWRYYSKDSFVLTPTDDNITITKVVLTHASSYNGGYNDCTYKVGNATKTATASEQVSSGTTLTLTPSEGTRYITFSPKGTSRVTGITITYTNNGSTELGEITCTTSDGQSVENGGSVSVPLGTSLTFKAENATSISYYVDSSEELDEADGNSITWTPSQLLDDAGVLVYAFGSEGEEVVFECHVTVTDDSQGGGGSDTPSEGIIEDIIDKDSFNMSGNTYTMYQYTSTSTGAVYAAKANLSTNLQINTTTSGNNINSGVASIVCPDGYVISKIEVTQSGGTGYINIEVGNTPCETADVGKTTTNAFVNPMTNVVEKTNNTKTQTSYILEPEKDVQYFRIYTVGGAAQISSIKVTYKPMGILLPVLKIGDEVLENNSVKDVLSGTKVDVSCVNADKIVATLDDSEPFDLTHTPYYVYSDGTLKVHGESGDKKGDTFTVTLNLATPAIPVAKIGDEILENDDIRYVGKGTAVTITCENALSLEGEINGVDFTVNELPYTLIINDDTELSVYGVNGSKEGEKFTYMFVIGTSDENMPALGSNYRQVLYGGTGAANVNLAEGYYVIARQEDALAMSLTAGSNNIAATGNIKVSPAIDNSGNGFSVVTAEGDDVLIVKLEQTGDDKWTIRTVNYGDLLTDNQMYLAALNETSTTLGFETSPAGAFINMSVYSNADISYAENFENRNRSIKLGGTTNKYFNYQTGGNAIQLYAYSPLRLFTPVFEDITAVIEDEPLTFTVATSATDRPEISYKLLPESENVSLDGGVLTATGGWQGKVVAFWPEDDVWFGGADTINVDIRQKSVMYFRTAEVRGKKDIGVVAQAVYYSGDGAVHYTSDCPDELTVNESTGMIRPDDIINAVIDKTYTITATADATDLFTAAEASYTVIIEAPEQAITSNEIRENFGNNEKVTPADFYSTKNWSKPITGSYGALTTTSVATGIEYTFTKVMYVNYSSQYFIQTDGSMSFRIPDNCYSIEFTFGANQTANIENTVTIGNSEAAKLTGIAAKGTSTYTLPENYVAGSEMKISAPSNRTLTIAALKFNIKGSAGTMPHLTFPTDGFEADQRVVNAFVGDTITMPALAYDPAVDGKITVGDIVFDIDEISESDADETYRNYDIFPTTFDDVQVAVYEPGVYTFRAKYPGNPDLNILSGMAILRMNVFPRLSVVPHTDSDNNLADDSRTESPTLTLVHATPNEEGLHTATIALPTLDELNDALKYSTVTLSKVVIRHGEDETVYAVKHSDELQTKAAGEELDITEMPEKFDFSEDGFVQYSMLYASTEDFFIEEKVHVVLMPIMPEAVVDESKVIVKPHSASLMQYSTFPYDPETRLPNPEAPDVDFGTVSLAAAEAVTWNVTGQSVTVERPVDLDDSQMYAVKFRSVKDISELVQDGESGTLGGDYAFYAIAANGMVSGVENVAVDVDDAVEAVYFNLSGIRVDKPQKGGIYIKVEGRRASKVLY